MKYTVSIAINGRIDVMVDADSFDEAKTKANLTNVDMHDMEVIDYHAVNATDENNVLKDYM